MENCIFGKLFLSKLHIWEVSLGKIENPFDFDADPYPHWKKMDPD